MFKAILATASILIGCWNPAAAAEVTIFDPTDWHLSCSKRSEVFTILTTDKGAKIGFFRDGSFAIGFPNEKPQTGTWKQVPQSRDVALVMNGDAAVIVGLQTKSCDAQH